MPLEGSDQVLAVDLADDAVLATDDVGAGPHNAVRTGDVTLTAPNTLQVVDESDPAAPEVLGELPTVRQPNSVAVG